MSTYIHFIGKQYYSIAKFIREAKKYGISRAIDQKMLLKLNFGDNILLAQHDGKKTIVFGFFKLHNILGIRREVSEELEKKGIVKKDSSFKPYKIVRGCGEYEVIGSEIIQDNEGFLKCLREKIRNKENIGRILIGGDFSGLNSLGFYEDFIYLPDIPFRQGFREINILELRKEYLKYKEAHPDKVVRLRGQFYSDPNCKEPTYLNEPCVHFEIENYKLN